jgi:hypothetical protein
MLGHQVPDLRDGRASFRSLNLDDLLFQFCLLGEQV